VNINDALGNQLFTYASAKSISLDLSVPFFYSVNKPKYVINENGTDVYGHVWYSDFDSNFNIDISERVEGSLEKITNVWKEPWPRSKNFFDELYGLNGRVQLDGHFCSPKYFQHNRKEVLEWFSFNDSVNSRAESIIKTITEKDKKHVIALHVRYGKDYVEQCKALDMDYYVRSVDRLMNKYDNARLILFSDAPLDVFTYFEKYDPVIADGNAFEDLCLMSKCNSHVIGNSTFGWWGAWLSKASLEDIIRPDIFPVANGENYPIDVFPNEWSVMSAKRISKLDCGKSRLSVRGIYNRLIRFFMPAM